MIRYKNYLAKVTYDSKLKVFHGDVIGLRHIITFEGVTSEELEQDFRDAIDDYLEMCQTEGIMPEKIISDKAIIQYISDQGIWVLVDDQEIYISFEEFPWFLKATIQQIYNLELFHGKYLHWPDLDVDIDLESLKYPEAYPVNYPDL